MCFVTGTAEQNKCSKAQAKEKPHNKSQKSKARVSFLLWQKKFTKGTRARGCLPSPSATHGHINRQSDSARKEKKREKKGKKTGRTRLLDVAVGGVRARDRVLWWIGKDAVVFDGPHARAVLVRAEAAHRRYRCLQRLELPLRQRQQRVLDVPVDTQLGAGGNALAVQFESDVAVSVSGGSVSSMCLQTENQVVDRRMSA